MPPLPALARHARKVMRTAFRAWALVGLLALGGTAAVLAEPAGSTREHQAEQKLAQIRADLRALAARQQELLGQREAAAARLRDADLAIARSSQSLQALEQQIANQQDELARLGSERDRRSAETASHRAALATLVRSLYAAGRHEQLRLLLAHDSIAELNRGLVYYRYLQRDRLAQARASLEAMNALARAEQAVQTQQQTLEESRAAVLNEQQALGAARSERAALIKALDREYREGQARARALGRDESALESLLESLRDVFADIPRELGRANGLASQRGRLPRPAPGTLRVGYSGRLPDGRPSQGWWIEAGEGTAVKAISRGRVAFADWMKGYGLLAIVDHGEGYMSLYASNDALRVEVGDWIEAGHVLGAAGRSGGFPAAGVYFELRRAGKPLDPAGWVLRR